MSNPTKLALELYERHPLLVTKIARSLLCNREEAVQALEEVIKFMSICAEDDASLATPSQRVDLAWHEFILFTRAYGEFCNRIFGKMIHHQPGGKPEANASQYRETLRRYEIQFGTPPERFWAAPGQTLASCGTCENSWSDQHVHVRDIVD